MKAGFVLPKLRFRHTAGFTLLETILYMAIFSVIIGGVALIGSAAVKERVRNQIMADLAYQGDAALTTMEQAIRSASNVTAPALAASSTSLTLASNTASANPSVFDSASNAGVTRLRLQEGAPATVSYLTNSHVVVSGLSFTNAGWSGTRGSVKIQFTLAYVNPAGRAEYAYQKTFYGTATLP